MLNRKLDSTAPLAKDFAERSVFVTGHTGFKGSWLSLWLTQLGAKVSGYSLAPPASVPSNFVVSQVAELLESHREADIRDFVSLSDAVDAANPDIIFHMAAQPLGARELSVST